MDDLEVLVTEAHDTERAFTALLQAICASILDGLPPEALRMIRQQCANPDRPTTADLRLRAEIEQRLARREFTPNRGAKLPSSG